MKNKTLYLIWCGLFILCAALGFIPAPSGIVKVLLCSVSAVFFIPGSILLLRSYQTKNPTHCKAVIALSLSSLIATLVFLILNFLSINVSEAAGNLLYGFLVIFSSPMVCSQYWFASIFLWACLLMTGLSLLHRIKSK